MLVKRADTELIFLRKGSLSRDARPHCCLLGKADAFQLWINAAGLDNHRRSLTYSTLLKNNLM